MRAFGRTISIAAVLVSVAGMAAAADIRVLSVGAVQNAVRPLAVDFSRGDRSQDRVYRRLARGRCAEAQGR